MTEGVKYQFHPVRNAQFVVDPQQRFLYRAFLYTQLPCDLAVIQALGDQVDGLLFPGREHNLSSRVDKVCRGAHRQSADKKSHLLRVCPELSLMNTYDAAAQGFER